MDATNFIAHCISFPHGLLSRWFCPLSSGNTFSIPLFQPIEKIPDKSSRYLPGY